MKLSVLKFYFKACGYWLTVFLLIFFVLSNTASLGSNIWLSEWSNDAYRNNTNNTEIHKSYRLGVYALLGFVQCVISFFSDLVFLFWALNAAKSLHNSMLYSILRSTMEFFESTPTGRIINRFSKDLDASDRTIPESFKSLLRCMFHVISTVLLISVSTPWFLTTLVPVVTIYLLVQVKIQFFYLEINNFWIWLKKLYLIKRYFVASMRQLKRLESVSKSPIFSHFSETLNGVSTVRAYRVQGRFVQKMQYLVNENLTYYFPNNISNRWLALRLELLGNLVTIFAALFAVLGRSTISAGIAALSITYSLNVSWPSDHKMIIFSNLNFKLF